MRVLLIVDLQVDFCPGGALAVPEGDQIVRKINELMESGAYDLVIASKDWHPHNHISFASSHPGAKIFDVIDANGLKQTLWPDHCVQNSPGAEFHPELNKSKIDKVIYKGTDIEVDSYSALFDNGRLHETDLQEFLEAQAAMRGVKVSDIELDICGLALDYCVKFSGIDAAKYFKTRVIEDLTRAVNVSPGDGRLALREMEADGVEITDSRALVARPATRELRGCRDLCR